MATIGELTRQHSRFPKGRAVTLVGVSAEVDRTIFSGLPIAPTEDWFRERGIPKQAASVIEYDATIGEVLYRAPGYCSGSETTALKVLASSKSHQRPGEIIHVDSRFKNYIGGKGDSVAEELAKAHIFIDPVLDPNEQIVGVDIKKGWVFKSHGFNIAVQPAGPYITRHYGMTPNTLAGEVDFTPNGRSEFTPENMSENILAYLVGFQKFFTTVDQGKPEPVFLYGKTNKHMAQFAARFGFTHRHDGRSNTPDGTNYRVFGSTQVVRDSLDLLVSRRDMQGRSVIDRLKLRV